MTLQRKIPKKTPLASKALDLLLDLNKTVIELSNSDTPHPPRIKPFVPAPPSTLSASILSKPLEIPTKKPTYDNEFAAKLKANLPAIIIASPARMDRLTRMVLPSHIMIKIGLFSSECEDGRKKILLSAIASSSISSSGSKGYMICRKQAVRALIAKNRWISIIPPLLATSSKSAQASVLVPLNETMRWLKKKKENQSESSKINNSPAVQFDCNPDLPDLIPDMLVSQMTSFISQKLLKHHIFRLGLPLPNKTYYFVLSWVEDGKPEQTITEDPYCTAVIFIQKHLSAVQSDKIHSLISKNCKLLEQNHYVKIPSDLGMQLLILIRQYNMYKD